MTRLLVSRWKKFQRLCSTNTTKTKQKQTKRWESSRTGQSNISYCSAKPMILCLSESTLRNRNGDFSVRELDLPRFTIIGEKTTSTVSFISFVESLFFDLRWDETEVVEWITRYGGPVGLRSSKDVLTLCTWRFKYTQYGRLWRGQPLVCRKTNDRYNQRQTTLRLRSCPNLHVL